MGKERRKTVEAAVMVKLFFLNWVVKIGMFSFFILFFFFFFFFFVFSRATPAACGGSQARGLIGAVAAGLQHSLSNLGSEPCLQPTSQLVAMPNT